MSGARMSVAVHWELDTTVAEESARAAMTMTLWVHADCVAGMVVDVEPCEGCGERIGSMPRLAGRSLADDGAGPPRVPGGWWESPTPVPLALELVDEESVDAVVVHHDVARCRVLRDRTPAARGAR